MDRLAGAGLLESESRVDVLSNQLVVVVSRSSTTSLDSPGDLRRLDGRIAMADPEAVPAGVYAREYLSGLGLWQELGKRIVPTLDVRAALAAVGSGNVEAGFVYRTDAGTDPRVRIAFEVPAESGPRIVYPLAIVRGRETEDARILYRFLRSSDARAVFEGYDFRFLEGR
jgi:molybdate transport system substrate-binding protein